MRIPIFKFVSFVAVTGPFGRFVAIEGNLDVIIMKKKKQKQKKNQQLLKFYTSLASSLLSDAASVLFRIMSIVKI